MKRGEAVLVPGVHLGPGLDQGAADVGGAPVGGHMQGRAVVLAHLVRIGAVGQQRGNGLDVPASDQVEQGLVGRYGRVGEGEG